QGKATPALVSQLREPGKHGIATISVTGLGRPRRPADLFTRIAQGVDQQPELTFFERDRRASTGMTKLLAGLGQVERRPQSVRTSVARQARAVHALRAAQQAQLSILEPQAQRTPPAHLGLRPPDQFLTSWYTTPLTPANKVPMIRFVMNTSSTGTGPAGGA